ncbi:MAG: DNA/RNA nuclease SfsA [Alphaproteobacteria bacterium]
MEFPQTLIPGRLIKRYKRFLADIAFADGSETTAHCANPGSMLSVSTPGSAVWLSRSDNPKRKLPLTLELIETPSGLVGINPMLANRLAEEAIESGRIATLDGYDSLRREVRYGENSRIDLLLEAPGRPPCHVEVKSVTLRRPPDGAGESAPGLAEFPDAVTTRGAKHLRELTAVVEAGGRAVMLYIVQRGDCDRFSLAGDIDPGYREAYRAALAAGVEMLAVRCSVTPQAIEVGEALPIVD